MLAIRLKRIGRSNLAQYRVIVQDSRRHPKRGAVVEYLGTYDPHAKTLEVDKDRVKHFLSNGAQPSNTIAKLLKKDGMRMPKWVTLEKKAKRQTKNPEKLRKNQPKDAKSETKPAEEPKAEETKTDEPVKEEAPAETAQEEAPDEAAKETQEETKPQDKPEDESQETPKEEPAKPEEAKKD